MLLLLMFLYIFSLKIYSVFDSTILVGMIMFIFLITKGEYRKKVLNGLNNKYFISINICILLLLSWSFISLLINNSLDLSYIKTLLHLYISLIIGYLVFHYFDFKGKKREILNYILLAFFVQSCLQWLFFLFPSISKLFNIFRTEAMILNNHKYDGYRGLALSSTGFFGLSSAYALISMLFFTKHNTLYKYGIKKYIFFLIMYSGTFFAGRTGFISIPFIIVLAILDIKSNQRKNNKKLVLKRVIVVFVSLICLFLVTYKIPKFNNMYNYAFELVQNVFKGKGFFTTSTDKMFKMYDIDLSKNTLLWGDGKYTIKTSDGHHYYKNTDIGYLRKILFFGIPGLLLSFYFEFILFGKNMKIKINKWIFFLLLIVELKGEIIGIAILMNSILILYNMLDLSYNNENDGRIKRILSKKKSKSKPLISIIIPSYNSSQYIINTIDSILNQKYKNIEVIIVDDGSTDNSLSILKNTYSKNNKVKIYTQKNAGAPTARNYGLSKSIGTLISFFDSDDIMDQNYLLDALKYYNNEDLIITDFVRFSDKNPKLSEETFVENSKLNLEENLYLIPAFPCNKIYKRKIILDNKLEFDNVKIAQDLNFYLKYLSFTKKVRIINKKNIYYRIHDKSISTTYNMNLIDLENSINLSSSVIDKKYKYLLKMVRIKHYTTQLLKMDNYSDNNAKIIRDYFRKNAIKNKIYFMELRYICVMFRYIVYQLCVFVIPIKYGKKISQKIKERMNNEN